VPVRRAYSAISARRRGQRRGEGGGEKLAVVDHRTLRYILFPAAPTSREGKKKGKVPVDCDFKTSRLFADRVWRGLKGKRRGKRSGVLATCPRYISPARGHSPDSDNFERGERNISGNGPFARGRVYTPCTFFASPLLYETVGRGGREKKGAEHKYCSSSNLRERTLLFLQSVTVRSLRGKGGGGKGEKKRFTQSAIRRKAMLHLSVIIAKPPIERAQHSRPEKGRKGKGAINFASGSSFSESRRRPLSWSAFFGGRAEALGAAKEREKGKKKGH